jgi:ribonuclease E
MVKRMLVDANHPEETRVVVIDGTRLEAFDLETSTKEQNKGNIYLAKVVRVEPSLQAAFVDYGGNRHGFLAFSEIHPDYYQIPVADREALIAEAKAHDETIADDDDLDQSLPSSTSNDGKTESLKQEVVSLKNKATDQESLNENITPESETSRTNENAAVEDPLKRDADGPVNKDESVLSDAQDNSSSNDKKDVQSSDEGEKVSEASNENSSDSSDTSEENSEAEKADQHENHESVNKNVEEVGGEDETEENLDSHRRKFVASRRYKIQEVIKRKQILLIQVVKEERGNKGAALTTYLSLAGRYCVLMPNSARGGGVSRKITNVKDRRRLKSIVSDLKIPEHMAVICEPLAQKEVKLKLNETMNIFSVLGIKFVKSQWNLVLRH